MLADKLGILRNIARIEVGHAQVKQYVENVSEVENGNIEAVHLGANGVLHSDLDAEQPERFDQQICQQNPEQSR